MAEEEEANKKNKIRIFHIDKIPKTEKTKEGTNEEICPTITATNPMLCVIEPLKNDCGSLREK